MAIAREQARGLLTDSEMVLFGESRNPALRSLTGRELTRRIERVRKLRDKARDLLQRQRLGSRQRTGSKGGKSGAANERTARKGEMLDDILQRFEGRLQELERSGQSEGARQAAGAAGKATGAARPAKKSGPAKQAGPAKKATGAAKKAAGAAKKATGPAKKASPAKKAAGQSTRAQKPADATAKPGRNPDVAGAAEARASAKTPSGTTGEAPTKRVATRRPGKTAVSREQALASTHELLQANQKRAREPRGYPGDQGDEVQTDPGYQPGQAKSKALELHAGEMRQEPIHGSISTRDRKNQAKRDRT
ncbi:MAG: hypothetical protein M3Q11_06090 [Pseudomonadota bacterium]|nr:hypothetical protein [Pseudomonadota bacterium]